MSLNPLAPALEAAKAAWIDANAVYRRDGALPAREWLTVFKAYTALQAATARLEIDRRRRGFIEGEAGIDLSNVVAFERVKPKRRRARAPA